MRRLDLREACREEYGDEFVREYDALNEGVPVGDFEYTIDFLKKLEAVREKLTRGKRRKKG